MTSPSASPAWAAADPFTTPATGAPPEAELPSPLPKPPNPPALDGGETSTPRNGVAPMCTVDDAWPASIWLAIDVASVIGMANAWVAGCCDCEPNAVVEMLLAAAVFLPHKSH